LTHQTFKTDRSIEIHHAVYSELQQPFACVIEKQAYNVPK